MRRRGLQAYLALITLAFGLYLSTLFETSTALPVRLAWALLLGAAFTAAVTGAVLMVIIGSTRRAIARRIRPGDELTSRFEPTTLELAGPLSRHELTYEGLTSVTRVGDWVHLRQVGSSVTMMWPTVLFPEQQLAHLQRLAVGRTRSSDADDGDSR